MRIAIVGQNPSRKSPYSAFENTKSGQRIEKLLLSAGISLESVRYYNVVERAFAENEYPKWSEFKNRAESFHFHTMLSKFDMVIACGRFAERALLHGICYHNIDLPLLAIPHPSPRNRIWNNAAAREEVINSIREEAAL